MNLLELQKKLKFFRDDALQQEMQQPSGSIPQFLVLAELNRRKELRSKTGAMPKESVKDELSMSNFLPQTMPGTQNMNFGFSHGGIVQGYSPGGIVGLAEGSPEMGPIVGDDYGLDFGFTPGMDYAQATGEDLGLPEGLPKDYVPGPDSRFSTPLAPGQRPTKKPAMDLSNPPWRRIGESDSEYFNRRNAQDTSGGEVEMPYDPMTKGWLTAPPSTAPSPKRPETDAPGRWTGRDETRIRINQPTMIPGGIAAMRPGASGIPKDFEGRTDYFMNKYMNKDDPYAGIRSELEAIRGERGDRKNQALGDAMMAMGLGLMANKSPYFGVAAGEAGLAALKGYKGDISDIRKERMEQLNTDAKLVEAKLAYDRGELQKAYALMHEYNLDKYRQEALAKSGAKGEESNLAKMILTQEYLDTRRARDRARDDFKGLEGIQARNRLAQELKKDPKTLTQQDVDDWIERRFPLRLSVDYKDGKARIIPREQRPAATAPGDEKRGSWVKQPDGSLRYMPQ